MHPFKAIILTTTLFGSFTISGQGAQASTSIHPEINQPHSHTHTLLAVSANTPSAQLGQLGLPQRAYGSVLTDHDQDPTQRQGNPKKTKQKTANQPVQRPPVLRYGDRRPAARKDTPNNLSQKNNPAQ
jgi:hypothetical protein